MKKIAAAAASFLTAAICWTLPHVDGKIAEGEYARSISLVYGDAAVYYQVDSTGGLYVAVSAPTEGWVGLGLGSVVMDGAHIFMGYVTSGQPVLSEQIGEGHSHHPSPIAWADLSAMAQNAGVTTLEIHIPADKMPKAARKIGFIVAFSSSADLTTYHDDNHDGGFMDLSAP